MAKKTKPSKPSADEAIKALVHLTKRRKGFIQFENANTNRVRAISAGALGYHSDLSEEEGEAITKTAAAIITAYLNDKPLPREAARISEDIWGDLAACRVMLEPILTRRHEIELQMKQTVRHLPIAKWAKHKDRNGLGEVGLAAAIGEAGDFSLYSRDGLRKRLGLAPFTRASDGVTRACSTWRMGGGLSKDEWSDDDETGYKGPGYSPRRRATIYADVQDSLLRAQWRGADKHPSGKAGPIGPYGAIYGTYKAKQIALNEAGAFKDLAEAIVASLRKNGKTVPKANLEGRLTAKHIDNRAKRYMVQKLFDHIGSECRRRASGVVPERASFQLPAAIEHRPSA
ncbi:MAG TPA: hypothetical protein VGQ19_10560 [Burkholderiales bacterium]|jgi:hypothetical protein|nr:hypothetical protein [Burkholderiales bacterium]